MPSARQVRRGGCAVTVLAALLALSGCSPAQIGRQATAGAVEGLRQGTSRGQQSDQPDVPALTGGLVQGTLAEFTSPEGQQRLQQVIDQATTTALRSAFDALRAKNPGGASTLEVVTAQAAGVFQRRLEQALQHSVAGLTTHPAGGGDSPAEALAGQAAGAFRRELVQGLSETLGPDGQGPLTASLGTVADRAARAAVGAALAGAFPGCTDARDPRCVDRRLGAVGWQVGHGLGAGLTRGMLPLLLVFVTGLVLGALLLAAVGATASWWRGRRDRSRAGGPLRQPAPQPT